MGRIKYLRLATPARQPIAVSGEVEHSLRFYFARSNVAWITNYIVAFAITTVLSCPQSFYAASTTTSNAAVAKAKKKKVPSKQELPQPTPEIKPPVEKKEIPAPSSSAAKKKKKIEPVKEQPTPTPEISKQPEEPQKPQEPQPEIKPTTTTDEFDLDFGTVSATESSLSQHEGVNLSDFDVEFKDEDTRPRRPIEQEELPAKEVGLPIELPYLGKILLIPFTDEKTKKSGFKAKFADQDKKITIGNLVIDEGTITVINDKLGITGRATLFDKQAVFGLKEVEFAEKMSIKKAIIGVTYTDKPQVEVLPGKVVTLNETNIVLEKNKPVVVEAVTNLFGQTVSVGFVLITKSINLFFALTDAPLTELIPSTKGTILDGSIIRQAKISAYNIWALQRAKQPLQATIKGVVDLSTTPSAAAQKTASPLDITFDPTQTSELNNITFDATVDRTGIIASLALNTVPMPNIGTIYKARIDIDTTKEIGSLMLMGELAFDVPLVGTLPIIVASEITKEGVQFAGTVPTDVSYADFSLKGFTAAFDTKKKLLVLSGNVVIEGLELIAMLTLLPDRQNPEKRTISFFGRSKAKELQPFTNSGIPGIETFKITDFDAGVGIETVAGKQITQLELNGDFHFLGKSLRSSVKFVRNEKGEKGIYVNAPLTKDKTISDILPTLKNNFFDNLVLKEGAFFVSTIDFYDIEKNIAVKKGLSFLAKVPLAGSLKDVGKFLGTSNQDFTLYGKIMPNNPSQTEFGIILSQGTVDPSAKFSLGQLSLAINASGSFSILANLIFRPEPKEIYDFTGKIALNSATATANLNAFMVGSWNNAFGLSGWSITDPALDIGIIYGSPGIPTELGGGAHLIVKDKLDLSLYFKIDAGLRNIAFEGTTITSVSPLDMIKLIAQAWGINLKEIEFADVRLRNLHAKYAPKDTLIGNHLINMGLAAAADIDILGKTAHLDIRADLAGIKALAELDPIDIGGVLKVTGRAEDKKPKVSIGFPFLQPDKAHFLVTGKFEIPEFYSVESHFKFDKTGIEFNFEDNLGGDRFNWDGKPLLRSQVTGTSTGTWEKPDFIISIVFEQYLKKYLTEQIEKGFNASKDLVSTQLGAVQKEIGKVKDVIKSADARIKAAKNLVEDAKKSLSTIDTAISETQTTMKKAQQEVDSIKNEIRKLDAWYAGLPKA